MTSRFYTTAPADPSPRTQSLQRQLEQAFGTPLSVWKRTPTAGDPVACWQHSNRSDQLGTVLDEHERTTRFNQLVTNQNSAPQLWPLNEDQAILAALSEADDFQPEIIVGVVRLNPWMLAQAAAQQAVQQAKHIEDQEMLEHYATRLSASFEELYFLRRLSQHVDHCVANRPPIDVAADILPDLRQLLEVEVVCLIKASPVEGETHDAVLRAERVVGLAGQLMISEADCCDIITRFGAANRRVLVRNFHGTLSSAADVPLELKSLVLAPINTQGQIFGWLVGLNKQADTLQSGAPHNSLGHGEIGSMEATLLEASAMMLGSHVSNHRLFQDLDSLLVGITHTLVGAIEARDAYTSGHSDRVALMGRRLATQLGLSPEQCQDIFLCGLLHDIGKIGIPDHILQKPGRLTEEEFDVVKQHPEVGARLLRGLKPLEKLLPGVLHHHESYDGSGYPYGLQGEEIPLMARILAVADAFDAMTSDRPYRAGMPVAKAASILEEGRNQQWDGRVLQAFCEAREDIERICQHFKVRGNKTGSAMSISMAAPLGDTDPALAVASLTATAPQ